MKKERIKIRCISDDCFSGTGWQKKSFMKKGWETYLTDSINTYLKFIKKKRGIICPENNKYGINFLAKAFVVIGEETNDYEIF